MPKTVWERTSREVGEEKEKRRLRKRAHVLG